MTDDTKIEAEIPINNMFSFDKSPLPITSSSRYFVDQGSTRLASLLMMIRIKPTKIILRLGQIMVLKTVDMVTFDFGLGADMRKSSCLDVFCII